MISSSKLHHILIKEIIEKGYLPGNDYLANYFNTDIPAVEKALRKLADDHGLVLHPNQAKVWVVHPFSLAPTNFFIKSSRGQWWANCAWCALGAAALINTDLTISTSIGAEEKPLTLNIGSGKLKEQDLYVHFPIPMKNAWENVIYTCSTMLVFESEQQIDLWVKKHHIPKGDVQPIQNVWQFSKKWYGNHLNPNWVKWTTKDAKKIFAEFNLDHPVWSLGDSDERF